MMNAVITTVTSARAEEQPRDQALLAGGAAGCRRAMRWRDGRRGLRPWRSHASVSSADELRIANPAGPPSWPGRFAERRRRG